MNNNFNDNLRLYDDVEDKINYEDNQEVNTESTQYNETTTGQTDDDYFYQNNQQKGSAGLVILIVILCLVILGLLCYIAYDKFFKDKINNSEIVETKLEDITNESIVNDLQNSIIAPRPSSIEEKSYFGLYLNANKDNIDPKYLIYYGMSKLIEEGKLSENFNELDCKATYVVSKNDLNNYIKNTFNIDISKYYLLEYTFQEYTIRQANDDYEMSTYGCKTGSTGNVLNKLIKAEKDNDNIYIYSYNLITNNSVGFLETFIGLDRTDDGIYVTGNSSDNSRYEIYDGVKSVIESNLTDDELLKKVNNIYKVTFTKDASGEYHWTSSERVTSLDN